MKKTLIGLILAAAIPLSASAQVLDSVPEYQSESSTNSGADLRDTDIARTGMCLSGTSGLMSVPTPDFQKDRRVSVSYKSGVTNRDITADKTKYDLEKNEQWISAAYSIKPNLEISLNHLQYDRSSSPYLGDLNYEEDSTGFGMKYSTHIASQDFCFGGVFAPMSASELNSADLVQIENLRSVYMTLGEKLTDNINGFLNLKHCFTDNQTVELMNGRTLEYDRKEFLVSAIALEYAPSKNFAFMFESQFMNYRDFFSSGSDRVSLNVGIRGGAEAVQAEVFVMSFNDEPDLRLGLNIGF